MRVFIDPACHNAAGMPFYYKIDSRRDAGRRTAQRLLVLREKLAEQVPRRTLNDTLLLATWNIREFDSRA